MFSLSAVARTWLDWVPKRRQSTALLSSLSARWLNLPWLQRCEWSWWEGKREQILRRMRAHSGSGHVFHRKKRVSLWEPQTRTTTNPCTEKKALVRSLTPHKLTRQSNTRVVRNRHIEFISAWSSCDDHTTRARLCYTEANCYKSAKKQHPSLGDREIIIIILKQPLYIQSFSHCERPAVKWEYISIRTYSPV